MEEPESAEAGECLVEGDMWRRWWDRQATARLYML